LAKKNKVIHGLLISGIADRGKSVGKTNEGEVVFVDGAVPGDVVDVLVIRSKKNMGEAVVKSYVSYSPDRTLPVCNHFGLCGGCKWQHLKYEAQLFHKEQTVRDCMKRIGKLDENLILPIIGCEPNYRYRNKLEFSFSTKRWMTEEEISSGEEIHHTGALGFHKAGFFDKIIDIHGCFLQDETSDHIRNFVRDFAYQHGYEFYDLRNHTGFLRNMIVRNSTLGDWMVTVVFGYADDQRIYSLLDALKEKFPRITSLNYVINDKVNDTIFDKPVVTYHGKPYMVENLGPISYRIGPKSFFQINSRQAVRLFDVAVQFAELSEDDNVYDLYTGLGSIALYIASKVGHVTGIEEIPEAIEDARVNMEFNGIKNATFYAGDVKHLLNKDFLGRHGKPDVIITDPPRQGMHENVVNTLLELEAPRIVYISCNPATQARDLALLSPKYEVLAIQPVDMFPHTHHIESVAKLKLRS